MTVQTYQFSMDDAAFAAAKTALAALPPLATALNAATIVNPTPPPSNEESPDGTTVTTVGPLRTDSTLKQQWGMTAAGLMSLNGTPLSNTASVTELAYVSKVVWQKNASAMWYSVQSVSSSGAVTFSAGTTTSPLPTPPPSGGNGYQPTALANGWDGMLAI